MTEEVEKRTSGLIERLEACAGVLKEEEEDGEVGAWSWEGAASDSDASYLVMKQELLLAYCTNLSFYLVLKARGESVKNHPVLDRLSELRFVFEKMKPIESKLRHQLDKVLSRRPEAYAAAPRANPLAMTGDAKRDDDGVYRPPRLQAAFYPGDKKKKKRDDDDDEEEEDAFFGNNTQDEDIEDMTKRANKSAIKEKPERKMRMTRARRSEMMSIIRDSNDGILEQGSSTGGAIGDVLGTGNKAARRERLNKEAREQTSFEESRFMRVAASKKLKKKRKVNPFANTIDDLI